METLRTIAILLPLSLTSGIDLYATVLVVGLSIRFGWVQNVPPGLRALESWPVIIVAGVLFSIEFLADKIQFIDNLWDTVHTFIRPLGAAIISITVLGKIEDPAITVIAALAMGGIAFISHGGKAGSRVTLNVISPAENVTNMAISLAEDLVVGILAFLALKYPFVATGIALVILALIVILVPRLLRWMWFTVKAVFARLKGLVKKVSQPDSLPSSHMALLDHQAPELTSRCTGQSIKGASGRAGYISVMGNHLLFTYNRWFGSRVWQVELERVISTYLRHRALMDVLEVHYQDDKQKSRVARFVFMKDRALLAEQFATRLEARAAG